MHTNHAFITTRLQYVCHRDICRGLEQGPVDSQGPYTTMILLQNLVLLWLNLLSLNIFFAILLMFLINLIIYKFFTWRHWLIINASLFQAFCFIVIIKRANVRTLNSNITGVLSSSMVRVRTYLLFTCLLALASVFVYDVR